MSDTTTTDTDSDDTEDIEIDICPHCDNFDSIEEKGDDDTEICTVCYTTPDGETLAQIDVKDDEPDYDEHPHLQSPRPRYAGAVEHGRAKQCVMYGAFPHGPNLASIEDITV